MKKLVSIVAFATLIASYATSYAAAPQIVASVAALRAGNFGSYASISLSAYVAGGTAGGGELVYFPSDTTTADNSCTVFVDAAGHRFKRQPYAIAPEDCGATGNGVANDAVALQRAITAAAAVGSDISLVGTYFIGATSVTVPSNTHLKNGGGSILGTAVSSTGCLGTPSACFATSTISATGTLGSSVSLGAGNIPVGTSSFSGTNTFAPGDQVRISNATGASTSRMEILYVLAATGSTFTTTTGTIEHYAAATSAIAQKVTPVSNVILDGVTLQNINFQCVYCASAAMRDVTALASQVQFHASYSFTLDFKTFNPQQTLNEVDALDASMDFSVTGHGVNSQGISQNSLFKALGVHNYKIDVDCEGTINAGGSKDCVQIDMDYNANPFGFPYLSNVYGNIRAVEHGIAGNAVDITNTGTGVSDAVTAHFSLSGVWPDGFNCSNSSDIQVTSDFGGSTGAGFQLNGCSDINFNNYNGASFTLLGTNTNIRGVPLSWTPSDGSGEALTFTSVSTNYVLANNMVTAYGQLTYPTTGSGASSQIDGLPIAAANVNYATVPGQAYAFGLTQGVVPIVNKNTSTFNFWGTTSGVALTNAMLSARQIVFSITYPVK